MSILAKAGRSLDGRTHDDFLPEISREIVA